jgi:hypothetical protein
VRAPVEHEPLPLSPAGTFQVGRRPRRCRARSPGGRRRSRRRPRAWPGGSWRPRVTEAGTRLDPDAAGPVGGGHLASCRSALTSPSRTAPRAGADERRRSWSTSRAARLQRAVGDRDRAELDPLAARVVHAPGAGVQARIRRSTATAGSVQSTRASSTVILGAKLTPSAAARGLEGAVSMPSRVAQQPAAALGEPAEQVAGGVVGRIRSVITPNVGPASSSLTMRNVVAPVTSSPAQIACCTGAPAPGGQHEKCRLTQPCAGCRAPTAAAARRTRRPGSSPGRARAALLELGSRGWSGLRTGTPSSSARCATGTATACGRGRRGVGRVTTPTSSCAERRRRRGRAGRPRGCRRRRRRIRGRAVGGVRETLTVRLLGPNHSASRIAFIAALRARGRAGRRTGRRRGGRSRAGSPGRAAREPSIVTGSPYMSKPCATTDSARGSRSAAGDRQAALGPSWSPRTGRARVDQVPDLAVDVPGEHPQPDADLRRREAGPGRSSIVSVRSSTSRRSSLSKSTTSIAGCAGRVAEQADRLDGHGLLGRAVRKLGGLRSRVHLDRGRRRACGPSAPLQLAERRGQAGPGARAPGPRPGLVVADRSTGPSTSAARRRASRVSASSTAPARR